MSLENTHHFTGRGHVYNWDTDYRVIMPELTDCNSSIAFMGLPWSGSKQALRKYIHFLSQNEKVIIIDSEGDMETYNRFKKIKNMEQFQNRYHMKLSADDFIYSKNIYEAMDQKSINILKIKSIEGIMSAGELFPVIMKKIEADRTAAQHRINIVLNQATIRHIDGKDFEAAYREAGGEEYRFIFLCENAASIPEAMLEKTGNLVLFRQSGADAAKLCEMLQIDGDIAAKISELPVKLSLVI